MYISAITASGFRNLDGRFPFTSPLTVMVGENNSGKSSVIDALRILLEPESGPKSRLYLSPDDFAHDGKGRRTTDALEIALELRGLTTSEQARMITCLSPTMGAGGARLRMVAKLAPDNRVRADWFGGDSQTPDVERWAREAVTFTYLPPLRDAAADLRPGRDNKLVGLLAALAPQGSGDRVAIESIMNAAHIQLNEVESLVQAQARIQGRLSAMIGSAAYGHLTGLAFADPRFERIIASIRALAGGMAPLELAENGLGYNNLLYMSVLLSALEQEASGTVLRVLLIEEPEAHLHPQLQDLLMRYLEASGSTNTQVIATTHSPNLASSAMVERVTVVSRLEPSRRSTAHATGASDLTAKQLKHLRRFLDVTKASLLFAKGVILVEGIAEQLLIPVIADRLSLPLGVRGIAIINIGGVAFPPFLKLFGSNGLPHRCVVISDGDPLQSLDAEETEDAEPDLSSVARDLLTYRSESVDIQLATKTLEWDLAQAGNWDVMLEALAPIKPRVARRLRRQMPGLAAEAQADAVLAAVKDVKGRFAQELAELLSDNDRELHVPGYLKLAISWVAGPTEGA